MEGQRLCQLRALRKPARNLAGSAFGRIRNRGPLFDQKAISRACNPYGRNGLGAVGAHGSRDPAYLGVELTVLEGVPASTYAVQLSTQPSRSRDCSLRESAQWLFEHRLAPPLAPREQGLAGRGAMARHQLAQLRSARHRPVAAHVYETQSGQVAGDAEVAVLAELIPQGPKMRSRERRQLCAIYDLACDGHNPHRRVVAPPPIPAENDIALAYELLQQTSRRANVHAEAVSQLGSRPRLDRQQVQRAQGASRVRDAATRAHLWHPDSARDRSCMPAGAPQSHRSP